MMTIRDMENLVQRLQGRIEGIERKNAMLSANRAQRRKSVGGFASSLLRIGQSNTLYTGSYGTIYGANNSVSTQANVPVSTPSSATGAYSNGICYANLINANGTLGAAVWFINAPATLFAGGTSTPGISVPIPYDAPVVCLAIVVPVASGGSVTAYQPYFI